jgi:hypothetical protein
LDSQKLYTITVAALDDLDRLDRGLGGIRQQAEAMAFSGDCNPMKLWNMADLLLAGRSDDGTAPKGGTK